MTTADDGSDAEKRAIEGAVKLTPVGIVDEGTCDTGSRTDVRDPATRAEEG